MLPRLAASAACAVLACLLVILMLAAPGSASPPAGPNGVRAAETETATPASAIFLPLIGSGFAGLPTATFTTTPTPTATVTPTPTNTPTPTPTPPLPCSLPLQPSAAITITISPNRLAALEQMVGKVPLTVSMTVGVSGGVPPYSYCWDVEPDGHRDSTVANPVFTFNRPGVYNPLLVVFDAQGNGQYVGAPPPGSPLHQGGRP